MTEALRRGAYLLALVLGPLAVGGVEDDGADAQDAADGVAHHRVRRLEVADLSRVVRVLEGERDHRS